MNGLRVDRDVHGEQWLVGAIRYSVCLHDSLHIQVSPHTVPLLWGAWDDHASLHIHSKPCSVTWYPGRYHFLFMNLLLFFFLPLHGRYSFGEQGTWFSSLLLVQSPRGVLDGIAHSESIQWIQIKYLITHFRSRLVLTNTRYLKSHQMPRLACSVARITES